MRKKIFLTWCFFHLLFIVLINVTGSYNSYFDFHNKPKNNFAANQLLIFLNNPICRYYGRYTGAESGYGFFGINVRSNGLLVGECNGQKLIPDLKSYDANLRFFSLTNAITDHLLKARENDTAIDHNDLLNDYNDLVLKNIAITLYQKSNCLDTSVILSYNLLNFPTLADVRKGTPKKYELIRLLTMRYSLRKDEK